MQRILLLIILLMFLSLRFFFYYQERVEYKVGDTFKKEYTFLKEPKHNGTSQYFFIGKILITLPLFPQFEYGDRVVIEGKVEETEDGELLIVENPTITQKEELSPILAVSKFVRQRVSESVLAVLPAKEGGLLLGIVLGVRDRIPNDYYEELRKVGVLHIVAASGANISILAGVILPLLQRTMKRRGAIVFTASIILFYALLAGMDPPILRASVMAILTYSALIIGKKEASLIILLLSAWVMLFLWPQLVEDISFQLSFAATSGIILLKPLLDTLFSTKLFSVVKDDISTTFAAQVTTVPILLSNFGTFPLISFPVNILILWTVPLLMALAGIGAVISLLVPVVSYPLYLLCYPFLYYFGFIVKVGSGMELNIGLSSLPLPLIAGYYLFLMAIVIQKKSK